MVRLVLDEPVAQRSSPTPAAPPRRKVRLVPDEPSFNEDSFKRDYSSYATKSRLNPNPDDPRHFYDYRSLYKKAGGFYPDEEGHLPSEFKLKGHPRMVVDGLNTKTGKSVDPFRGGPIRPSTVEERDEIVGPESRAYPQAPRLLPTFASLATKATRKVADVMIPDIPNSVPEAVETAAKPFSPRSIDTPASRRVAGDVAAGMVDTAAGAGGALKWWGADRLGQAITEKAGEINKELIPTNPHFIDSVARGFGSAATFFVPGFGIGRGAAALGTIAPRLATWFGITSSSLLESMVEAGTVYNESLVRGEKPENASLAATKTFLLNVPLTMLTNRYGLFRDDTGRKIADVLKSGGNEGLQEALQEMVSNFSLHDPILGGVLESFGVGALTGSGIKSLQSNIAPVTEEGPSGPSDDDIKRMVQMQMDQDAPKAEKAVIKEVQTQAKEEAKAEKLKVEPPKMGAGWAISDEIAEGEPFAYYKDKVAVTQVPRDGGVAFELHDAQGNLLGSYADLEKAKQGAIRAVDEETKIEEEKDIPFDKWVKNRGGVNPDLESEDILDLDRPDLVNRKTGKSIDTLLESAMEQGVLPRGSTRDDVIAAIQGVEAPKEETYDEKPIDLMKDDEIDQGIIGFQEKLGAGKLRMAEQKQLAELVQEKARRAEFKKESTIAEEAAVTEEEELPDWVTESESEAKKAAREVLRKNEIDDKVMIEMVDQIEVDDDAFQEGRGREYQKDRERAVGVTYTGRTGAVIELAKDATRATGRHEAFHAVTNLLLDQNEQSVITKKYGDMEKAADAFGEYSTGKSTGDTVIDRIFAMIKEFLEKMGNYLESKGFQSADDVFKAIEEGKLGDRGKTEIRRTTEYSVKQTESEAFKKWFGSSKVVDENGKPLVVYHGSPESFKEFDHSKIGRIGTSEGKGFYFTPERSRAHGYVDRGDGGKNGKVYEVYLSIQKPMSITQNEFTSEMRRKIFLEIEKSYPDALSNYGDISFYGKEKILREAIEANKELNDLDFISAQINGGIGDIETVYSALKKLTGYDGVFSSAKESGQTSDVWVAFLPTQIKSATGNRGTFDPKDARIQYSVKPKSPIFFSGLQKLLEEKMPERAFVPQVKSIISNAKQEEVRWSGIEQFLEGKMQVSKKDLIEFLKANEVQVQEVVKSGTSMLGRKDEIERIFTDKGYTVGYEPGGEGDVYVEKNGKDIEPELLETENPELFDLAHEYGQLYLQEDDTTKNMPKFSNYQLPGGSNYREMLLTLPTKAALNLKRDLEIKQMGDGLWNIWDSKGTPGWVLKEGRKTRQEVESFAAVDSMLSPKEQVDFRSSHFDEPNILAHVRFNERKGPDGEKVLFIEEIQSDWGQKFRDEGGRPDVEYKQYTPSKYGKDIPAWEIVNKQTGEMLQNGFKSIDDAKSWWSEKSPYGIPSAPFIGKTESWMGLSLKRILRYAAENGFDKIAWTTGEQQAERYDLSKQIDGIVYYKSGQDTYQVAIEKDGKDITPREMEVGLAENDLSKYVGKDLAKKIINGEGELTEKSSLTPYFPTDEVRAIKRLSGLDLKVGGEGMKGFYDQMIPSFLNKYAKKWGGRVGTTKVETGGKTGQFQVVLPNGKVVARESSRRLAENTAKNFEGAQIWAATDEVHSLEITDSMRRDVLEVGQPQYSVKPTPEEKATQGQIAKAQIIRHQLKIGDTDWEALKIHVTSNRVMTEMTSKQVQKLTEALNKIKRGNMTVSDYLSQVPPAEPPEPPITSAEFPDPNDPINKVIRALRKAEPARGKQEELYSKERSKRLARALSVGSFKTGERGFYAELGQLKGEMPKVMFQSIRKDLTQNDIDSLFIRVKDSPRLDEWEKFTARGALAKLLGEHGGNVPTEGELILLNRVFPQEFIDAVMDMRPFLVKLKELGYEIANIPRSIMSSFDLSAPFRQAIFFSTRPQFYKAFPKMFKYFRSRDALDELYLDISNRPTFKYMKEAKLSMTDTERFASEREEKFQSSLSEKIPLIGHGIRASNRAYSGFLNKLRADMFDYFFYKAKQLKLDPDNNADLRKAMAEYVNAATGRGNLKSLERAATALNAFFFSPRLMASRLHLLNPVNYIKQTSFMRKEMLRDLFGFASLVILANALAQLAGADGEDDPTSSDFGKIRINNTRIDVMGGFGQYLVLASRLMTGRLKSSTSGKVHEFGPKFGQMNRLDILGRFVEYKEAPVFSFATGMLRGKNAIGEEFDTPKEIGKRFVPMVAQDITEIYRDLGIPGMMLVPLGLIGFGLQSYQPKEKKEKQSAFEKSSMKSRFEAAAKKSKFDRAVNE